MIKHDKMGMATKSACGRFRHITRQKGDFTDMLKRVAIFEQADYCA
jgi:hypothetical protein